jgi:hypothetical protein
MEDFIKEFKITTILEAIKEYNESLDEERKQYLKAEVEILHQEIEEN